MMEDVWGRVVETENRFVVVKELEDLVEKEVVFLFEKFIFVIKAELLLRWCFFRAEGGSHKICMKVFPRTAEPNQPDFTLLHNPVNVDRSSDVLNFDFSFDVLGKVFL